MLLKQREQLLIEIENQFVFTHSLVNLKDLLVLLVLHVNALNVSNPSVVVMCLNLYQLGLECLSQTVKFSTFRILVPLVSKYGPNSVHVYVELSLNLLCPSNLV